MDKGGKCHTVQVHIAHILVGNFASEALEIAHAANCPASGLALIVRSFVQLSRSEDGFRLSAHNRRLLYSHIVKILICLVKKELLQSLPEGEGHAADVHIAHIAVGVFFHEPVQIAHPALLLGSGLQLFAVGLVQFSGSIDRFSFSAHNLFTPFNTHSQFSISEYLYYAVFPNGLS